MEAVYEKYFRDNLPHIWCPGCGNGIVMSALARALDKLGYPQDDVLLVSGIGCSSRMSGYMDLNTIHTAHGRALAFATGAKVCEPRLKTFVVMGDGDAAAIGGNHFIHACRRNIDMTAIIINNSIYGMTGGQFSPLTPTGKHATTAPYGSIDRAFNLVELARGAGATYVARGDVFHAAQLTNLLVEASRHKGFAVVGAVATCPVSYGRYNNIPEPAEMLLWLRDNTVTVQQAAKMSEEELKDKIIIGKHFETEAVEYGEQMARLLAENGAAEKAGDE